MRSYYNAVWLVVLAVLAAGCPFEGTTKFSADTTDYTGDAIDSITVSTSGETLLNGRPATEEWRIRVFMSESFENLQQDMARGSGEYLSSLAHLARVPDGRQQAFFQHAMDRYGVTIRSGNITPEQLRLAVLTDWKAD
jgi:Protein of unknown function (DUF3015)